MNFIETQTRARQEPFDFMSVRMADEKKGILVPYNFAINENMVEAGFWNNPAISNYIYPGTWSKRLV